MKTKLTLSVDVNLVQHAKNLAREEGTTLSALFENHLRKLITESKYKRLAAEVTETYESMSPRVQEKLKNLEELNQLLDRMPGSPSPNEDKIWDYRDEKYSDL
jgi:hypothetical protein